MLIYVFLQISTSVTSMWFELTECIPESFEIKVIANMHFRIHPNMDTGKHLRIYFWIKRGWLTHKNVENM